MKSLFLSFCLLFSFLTVSSSYRYVGGDISLLPEYQKAGAIYNDENGNRIDLLPYMHELGMNAMRVRLFVNPENYTGADKDSNACQTLPYIIPLCKDIISNGFELLLDFHYSDTWADPAKQWIPKAWEGQGDDELIRTIYDYTKNTLSVLKEEGIVPDFIQPGNEISYGMLWGPYGKDNPGNHTYVNSSSASWQRLANLLNSAIKACREECPQARIIIHTERTSEVDVQKFFYNKMKELKVDYDIIGISYYPYFHGKINVLNNALNSLEQNFPEKDIMVVETGYPYAWEVPGTNKPVDYEYTLEGQNEFAGELVKTCLAHEKVTGIFWWWLEYNAKGTQLSGWYNAPLFDSRTGNATPALKTLCSFVEGNQNGIHSPDVDQFYDRDSWYDLSGRKIKSPSSGIYIHNGKLFICK